MEHTERVFIVKIKFYSLSGYCWKKSNKNIKRDWTQGSRIDFSTFFFIFHLKMHNLIKILHDKVFLNEVFYRFLISKMNFLNYSIMFLLLFHYLQSQFIRFHDWFSFAADVRNWTASRVWEAAPHQSIFFLIQQQHHIFTFRVVFILFCNKFHYFSVESRKQVWEKLFVKMPRHPPQMSTISPTQLYKLSTLDWEFFTSSSVPS